MSDVTVNPQEVAAKARALIEADVSARVGAVQAVADAVNEYDLAEARYREATTAHEIAWRAALAAGWNEKQLRETGLRAPGQTRTRKRATRTTTTVDDSSAE